MNAILVGASLLAMASNQSTLLLPDTPLSRAGSLPHRSFIRSVLTANPVGAKLARDSDGSDCINAECAAALASKPAHNWIGYTCNRRSAVRPPREQALLPQVLLTQIWLGYTRKSQAGCHREQARTHWNFVCLRFCRVESGPQPSPTPPTPADPALSPRVPRPAPPPVPTRTAARRRSSIGCRACRSGGCLAPAGQ